MHSSFYFIPFHSLGYIYQHTTIMLSFKSYVIVRTELCEYNRGATKVNKFHPQRIHSNTISFGTFLTNYDVTRAQFRTTEIWVTFSYGAKTNKNERKKTTNGNHLKWMSGFFCLELSCRRNELLKWYALH